MRVAQATDGGQSARRSQGEAETEIAFTATAARLRRELGSGGGAVPPHGERQLVEELTAASSMLAAAGRSPAAIGEELYLSVNTIRFSPKACTANLACLRAEAVQRGRELPSDSANETAQTTRVF